MTLAIFGIGNTALNLAVTLVILVLVAIWISLIVFTYLDARRRLEDPVLIGCAVVASLFPFVGTIVYSIVRPPEFLQDARERELEMKAAELRVRQLKETSCPKCEYPIQIDWLRCPQCRTSLKEPCPSCGKPVSRRWSACPYCESALAGGSRRERDRDRERDRSRSSSSKRASSSPSGSRPSGSGSGSRSSGSSKSSSSGSSSKPRSSSSSGSSASSERKSSSRSPGRQPASASAERGGSGSRSGRDAAAAAEKNGDATEEASVPSRSESGSSRRSPETR